MSDRYSTTLEEMMRFWARQQREERGDQFATESELAGILEDPLAWMELLRGYDAYEFMREIWSSLR